MDHYLGVDVGLVTTGCAVIAGVGQSFTNNYLCNQGKPVAEVRRRLGGTEGQFPTDLVIRDVYTTGSICYLADSAMGADMVENEVITRALATLYYVPGTLYCRRESPALI